MEVFVQTGPIHAIAENIKITEVYERKMNLIFSVIIIRARDLLFQQRQQQASPYSLGGIGYIDLLFHEWKMFSQKPKVNNNNPFPSF